MSDLEVELRKSLPEFPNDELEKLLQYLRKLGVYQFRDLEFLERQELLDSDFLTKVHAGRLFRSLDEKIKKETDKKEKQIMEEKEEKERRIKADDHQKKLQLKMLTLVDRKAECSLKVDKRKSEAYAKSFNNHTQLKAEATNRVENVDKKINRGAAVGGIGAGAAVGALAGPPGIIVGGVVGGLIGFGGGILGGALTREDRLRPKLQEAKKQADLDEEKLIEESEIGALQKIISDIDEEMSIIKTERKMAYWEKEPSTENEEIIVSKNTGSVPENDTVFETNESGMEGIEIRINANITKTRN